MDPVILTSWYSHLLCNSLLYWLSSLYHQYNVAEMMECESQGWIIKDIIASTFHGRTLGGMPGTHPLLSPILDQFPYLVGAAFWLFCICSLLSISSARSNAISVPATILSLPDVLSLWEGLPSQRGAYFPLQHVFNFVVRVIFLKFKSDRVMPLLKSSQWLPLLLG